MIIHCSISVIGWSTVVFGINSTSSAVRKCEMVRGEAECHFTLPDCIASAINPKYHSVDHPTCTCHALFMLNIL